MAKKATKKEEDAISADLGTKLRKLVIKNFGCIGSNPVSIDLDDVVVLVGRNNTGKSTILRAYEVLLGSSVPKLTIDDFPESVVDKNNLPEIELHTRITDNIPENMPGARWIGERDGEKIVRERWTWDEPAKAATRQGFDVEKNEWSKQVPWGAANVANSRRPKPHRIEAFAPPDKQIAEVVKLLSTVLMNSIKDLPLVEENEDGDKIPTDYGRLIEGLGTIQKNIVAQAQEKIDEAQGQMTELIQDVFQGYSVEFDAKPEEDLASCLNFFKPGAVLRMGPKDGHLSAAEQQGSGARRTLMWAALRYAEENSPKDTDRSNLLLLDEPELCLHPNAVREACKVLYDLPVKGGWQVMVTTHSPAFIDLSRDNTTIVRVERDNDGNIIKGTTVYRPTEVKLSEDEKEELKLLNLCDPHLCEFFFGGKTVIVEGDTEYTAFRYLMNLQDNYETFRDVHIVRARGKATICLIAKILNQFDSSYSVLHDCDKPTTSRKKKNSDEMEEIRNAAWTNNIKILDSVSEALKKERIRLLALVPDFEEAFFGVKISEEKPVNAWTRLKANPDAQEKVLELLHSLVDHNKPCPEVCCEWASEDELLKKWKAHSEIN